jgi:homoserine dehydrogenase
MAEQKVSLDSIVQRRPRAGRPGRARSSPIDSGAPVPVIMITHDTTEAAIRTALERIEADGQIEGRPQMIRIESI